jgi:hypothetical protein
MFVKSRYAALAQVFSFLSKAIQEALAENWNPTPYLIEL